MGWDLRGESAPAPPGGDAIVPVKRDDDRVLLYTDGACSGNPGPGGWGAILVHPSSGRRREISGASRATTNNRMELTAVIEGLRTLRRTTDVDVYSDSRYVVQGMSTWIKDWIRRGWKTSAGSKL